MSRTLDKQIMPVDSMVFCDFDGTITARDTLQAVCYEFIPAVAARVLPAIGRHEISLRAGVSELINNLPSAAATEIRDFVCREPLRKGFIEFAQQLKDWQIPLVVLSGGMGFCVEARLQPWRQLLHNVHALDIGFDRTCMHAQMCNESGKEALPKAAIMRAYGAGHSIAIGDSLSDHSMALQADRVFARDRLLSFMRDRNRAVEAFRDFDDILAALRRNPDHGHHGSPATVDCVQ